MGVIDRIKMICKNKGIAISRLEKECGFANAYLVRLKKDAIPADRLKKIAEVLDVPMGYLLEGDEYMDRYVGEKADMITKAIGDNPLIIDVIEEFKDINKMQFIRLKGYYDAIRRLEK